jgi:signal transduction histidine kinase
MRSERRGPPFGVVVAIVALIQIAGTHVAATHQPATRPLDGIGYALLLAGPLLLLLRRRAPVLMLGAVLVVTGAYFLLAYPYGPAPLSLALAIVLAAAARRRVVSWSVAGGVVVVVFAWALLGGGEQGLIPAAAVSAWLVIMVLIGEAVRASRERQATRRAQAEASKLRAQDEYRLALARDIHDVVAHSLSMINVRASVALHLADREPEQLRPALEAIKTASKESLVQVRELLGVLREDAPLAPQLSLDQLPALIADARHSGMDVRLEYDGDAAAVRERLGPEREAVIYRVVQEAVTNAVRHSGGGAITVRLGPAGADTMAVSVDDDGGGRQGGPDGNGLRGMRERVAGVGGTVDLVELAPGLGVHATLPLEPAAEGDTP